MGNFSKLTRTIEWASSLSLPQPSTGARRQGSDSCFTHLNEAGHALLSVSVASPVSPTAAGVAASVAQDLSVGGYRSQVFDYYARTFGV